MRQLLCVLVLATAAFAAAPRVEVLYTRNAYLCADVDTACVSVFTESRTLKITAPASGATAYQIDIVVAGSRPGERRTMTFLVQRNDRRYGRFADVASATFFTLPLDLDIPILDVWVNALVSTDEPFHQIGEK